MNNLIAEIRENRRIAPDTYEMVMKLPQPCSILPGQFLNIRLEGFYLRRPISICDWDDQNLTIIYKTVGRGTDVMAGMQPDQQLDILLPLGNGFPTEDAEALARPLLIGGGAGVPPMYGLCKRLRKQGMQPVAVLGFNTAEEVFYVEQFRQLNVDVVVTTADGSRGVKGFVTNGMQDLEYTSFYACGPEAMLRAVNEAALEDIPGWFSFEERMGCGFGACMGCSCQTKYGAKRICKDGPVLERGEIIW